MICSISGRVALAEVEDLGLDDLPAALLRAQVGLGQKHHADRPAPGFAALAAALQLLGEEVVRDFDVDAGAVAGLAIGVHGAAVPDGLQRIYPRLHHVAPRLAVERRHQSDAAVIVLLQRVIGAGQTGGVVPPVRDELGAEVLHLRIHSTHGLAPTALPPSLSISALFLA